MRLIDADELRNEVDNYDFSEYSDYSNMIDMVGDAPTIEAEPVKRGRLVNKGAGYVECSVCGQIYTNIALLYKCCPYCTARFDGGDENA